MSAFGEKRKYKLWRENFFIRVIMQSMWFKLNIYKLQYEEIVFNAFKAIFLHTENNNYSQLWKNMRWIHGYTICSLNEVVFPQNGHVLLGRGG